MPGFADVAADDDLPQFLRAHAMDHRPAGVPAHARTCTATWRCRHGSRPTELRIVSPLLQLDRLVGFVRAVRAAAAVRADLRGPRPAEDRRAARGDAPRAARGRRRLAESRQFEAYNRLTAFMMHDLKNSVAQLKLLVANAAASQAQPGVHRRRDRHDRQHRRAHDAADRAAAAARRCRTRARDVRARRRWSRAAVARCASRAARGRGARRRSTAPVHADPSG